MNMFWGVNTRVKGGGEVNDILPGAVSGVTSAFCAVGDNGATPAAMERSQNSFCVKIALNSR